MGNSSSVEEPTQEEGAAGALDDTINLLLVGTVGTGKSTTGNKILQLRKNPFRGNDSDSSVTTECQAEYSRYGGQVIKVVDMPGINRETSEEDAEKEVVEAAINALVSTPSGYDAFLIVIKHGKQDKVTEVTIDQLKKMFGDQIVEQYGILVVTHGDDFSRPRPGQRNVTYEEYCSQQTGIIKRLWEECNRRVVLFDNATNNAEIMNQQKQELLSIVQTMRSTKRYTPDLFNAAQKTYAKMVQQAKEQSFTQSIVKRIRLIMHDLEEADVEDHTKSETDLLLLKSKVEDQLENFKFMPQTSLNAEFSQLLVSLKKAVVMKQELVKMVKKYQAGAGDGNQGMVELRKKIDDMKERMKNTESELEENYWSFSKKDTTKMKLKENILSIIKGMFSRRK